MLISFLATISALVVAVSPIMAITIILTIPIVFLIFKKPQIGLILVIASTTLGQLAKYDTLLLTDLLMGLTLLSWLPRSFKKIKPDSISLPLILFLFWAMASWLLNYQEFGSVNSLLFLLRFAGFGVLGLLSFNARNSTQIQKTLICSLITVAVLGLLQIIVFPNLDALVVYGWDPHQGRLVSTWLDPNFVGMALILGLLLFLVKFDSIKPGKSNIGLSILFILTIVLTFSRSTYLALGVALISLFILNKPIRKTLGVVFLFILILSLAFPRSLDRLHSASEIDATARFRINSWQNTLEIAKNNIWLGVGYNNFKSAQIKYGTDLSDSHSTTGSDSSWLLILATTGIPGFILFSWFFISVLHYLYRQRDNKYSLVLFCFLVALFFHSQFVNSLFYSHLLVFWLLTIKIKEKTRNIKIP